VIVDHRLDGLIERVDRVAVLDGAGRLVAEGPPRQLFRDEAARLDALGVWTPVAAGLDAALAAGGVVLDPPPLTVDEVVAALPRLGSRAAAALAPWLATRAPRPARPGAEVVRLERASCRAPDGRVVLRDVGLSLRAGEVLALVGRNGAGKTTLALALAGLARLAAGRREGAAGGLAFQNPDLQFVAGSALDELRASLPDGDVAAASWALAVWGLSEVAMQHPLSLSEGQKRRLALAAVALVPGWRLVALDEPTAGLDALGAEVLAGFVQGLAAEGRAVVIVSHETDFLARVADRVAVVDGGGVAFCGSPAALFDDAALMHRAGLTAPAAHRVARALAPEMAC
jgi:energy-coupling factor transport system ATP-binding protein